MCALRCILNPYVRPEEVQDVPDPVEEVPMRPEEVQDVPDPVEVTPTAEDVQNKHIFRAYVALSRVDDRVNLFHTLQTIKLQGSISISL